MNFLEKLTEEQIKELKKCINLNDDELAKKRSQAILLLEEKISIDTLETLSGYKRNVIVKIRKIFIKKGLIGLYAKRKKKSPASSLTQNQKKELLKTLRNQTPNEFGYDCNFWTTNILADYILQTFKINYKSKTSMYIVFRQEKFSFHTPNKLPKQRDEKVIQKWKDLKLPILQAEHKKDDTIVLVGGEATIESLTKTQRIWPPSDQSAFIEDNLNKKSVYLHGFLNIKNGKAHTYKTLAQTGPITISILKELSYTYASKKIVIIWNNVFWYKSKAVRDFLSTTKQFKLYNFPPHSSELNPQMLVWKEMREKIIDNRPIKNIDLTAKEAINFINDTKFNYSFFGLH